MWIVQHQEHGLWNGHGWTQSMPEAMTYEDPDKALTIADAFHLTDCVWDRDKARNTVNEMQCTVRNRDTGEVYKAPALVDNKYIFARVNWREVEGRRS